MKTWCNFCELSVRRTLPPNTSDMLGNEVEVPTLGQISADQLTTRSRRARCKRLSDLAAGTPPRPACPQSTTASPLGSRAGPSDQGGWRRRVR